MDTGNTDSYRCLRDDLCYRCRHSVSKMGRTAAFERQLTHVGSNVKNLLAVH